LRIDDDDYSANLGREVIDLVILSPASNHLRFPLTDFCELHSPKLKLALIAIDELHLVVISVISETSANFFFSSWQFGRCPNVVVTRCRAPYKFKCLPHSSDYAC
jgi:hypothetical protein